ncbi:O-antigen ligase [Clostridium sp.]|uniref:O-antigen ligase family protein n=1 Tax=Clostridium sp. TaxID=1506 RepID=UPI001A481144|nr:O-antigen ligase family protein [Clostridium sp.]MBK5240534.1 O-antigen ligase family protein [Clostridium sp.]
MNFYRRILFLVTCVYITLLPLVPQSIKLKGIPYTDLILALVILAYLINLVMSKKVRENFVVGIIDFFTEKMSIFMVILLAIMFASAIYAFNKKLALTESVRFATYIFMYFIIKYELNNKKQINILLKCYIVTSFVLCSVGIMQYFTGFALEGQFLVIYETGKNVKIAATLYNPNSYGAYLILIIFPVIMLGFYEKNKYRKIIYILLSALILTNLLMTYSRNALLGFVLGLLVLTVIYSYKLIFALGGFGVLICFIPSVFQRIKSITNMSGNVIRIKLWKTALMMIKEHPILGVGNGNYVARYNEYIFKYKDLRYFSYRNFPTHNSYLKVQSELGIIGIGSFLGVVITALFRIRKFYRTTEDKFHKPFYMGVMASMVAFLFMNLSDNLFFVPKATTYFWFLLATAEALLNHQNV